jgi:predicted DNA-binding transcriptional regulator YafY
MAPPEKLTDADVKKIRRRLRAGEHQTELAEEFGVNRKTIRRRLDELEAAEVAVAARIDANRLRRQVAREKRRLLERDQAAGLIPAAEASASRRRPPSRRMGTADPYLEWLDRPKNLTWREAAAARGLTRMRNADSTVHKWVEREDVEARIDAGWVLDDA